ncbi:MAG: DUF6675 family protein [Acidobacteriota bacterium]
MTKWRPTKYRRVALAVIAAALPVWQGVVLGGSPEDSGPQPPCGAESIPPYPDLEHSPAIKVWDRSSLGRDWRPPACLGWSAPGFTTLVSTVARFHATSEVSLLDRIGAISGLTGMRYWSTTHQSWRTLIVSASALAGQGGRGRPDFSAADLAPGSLLYFQQSDSLSGKATYRMRVVSVSPDRLIFETENVTSLRYLLLTLFPPHELQAIYFLERESHDVWRYYSITRTGKEASSLAAGHNSSAVNRAVAFFRYLAGIPTDQEPPAAR